MQAGAALLGRTMTTESRCLRHWLASGEVLPQALPSMSMMHSHRNTKGQSLSWTGPSDECLRSTLRAIFRPNSERPINSPRRSSCNPRVVSVLLQRTFA